MAQEADPQPPGGAELPTAERSSPARVAVCIATYLRPQGLLATLQSLNSLTFTHVKQPAVEVFLIDNDPAGSASETYEAARRWLRWPLQYVHEPRRGISQVRNTAVAAARRNADFIAFIDDDEVADPQWLDELLHAQSEHRADAVLGPAIRVFEGEPPEWAVSGGYFEQTRYRTGARISHGGIGNALVRVGALPEDRPVFDDRLGISGGEDTLFFLRLARDGGRIIWTNEATIREAIPAHRARVGYVLKRVYRTANTWSFCERELDGSAPVLMKRTVKGMSRIVWGVALFLAGLIVGEKARIRGMWQVCYGAGNLTGLVGLRYDAYRSVPPG